MEGNDNGVHAQASVRVVSESQLQPMTTNEQPLSQQLSVNMSLDAAPARRRSSRIASMASSQMLNRGECQDVLSKCIDDHVNYSTREESSRSLRNQNSGLQTVHPNCLNVQPVFSKASDTTRSYFRLSNTSISGSSSSSSENNPENFPSNWNSCNSSKPNTLKQDVTVPSQGFNQTFASKSLLSMGGSPILSSSVESSSIQHRNVQAIVSHESISSNCASLVHSTVSASSINAVVHSVHSVPTSNYQGRRSVISRLEAELVSEGPSPDAGVPPAPLAPPVAPIHPSVRTLYTATDAAEPPRPAAGTGRCAGEKRYRPHHLISAVAGESRPQGVGGYPSAASSVPTAAASVTAGFVLGQSASEAHRWTAVRQTSSTVPATISAPPLAKTRSDKAVAPCSTSKGMASEMSFIPGTRVNAGNEGAETRGTNSPALLSATGASDAITCASDREKKAFDPKTPESVSYFTVPIRQRHLFAPGTPSWIYQAFHLCPDASSWANEFIVPFHSDMKYREGLIQRCTWQTALQQMQNSIFTERNRVVLLDWLVLAHSGYRQRPGTLFLTSHLLDRFMIHPSSRIVNRKQLQSLGITCLWIASKHEETYQEELLMDNLLTMLSLDIKNNCALASEQKTLFLRLESIILRSLNFNLYIPTTFTFLTCYLARLGVNYSSMAGQLALFLSELSILEVDFFHLKPSLVAAAAVYTSIITVMDLQPPSLSIDEIKASGSLLSPPFRQSSGSHTSASEVRFLRTPTAFSTPAGKTLESINTPASSKSTLSVASQYDRQAAPYAPVFPTDNKDKFMSTSSQPSLADPLSPPLNDTTSMSNPEGEDLRYFESQSILHNELSFMSPPMKQKHVMHELGDWQEILQSFSSYTLEDISSVAKMLAVIHKKGPKCINSFVQGKGSDPNTPNDDANKVAGQANRKNRVFSAVQDKYAIPERFSVSKLAIPAHLL